MIDADTKRVPGPGHLREEPQLIDRPQPLPLQTSLRQPGFRLGPVEQLVPQGQQFVADGL